MYVLKLCTSSTSNCRLDVKITEWNSKACFMLEVHSSSTFILRWKAL